MSALWDPATFDCPHLPGNHSPVRRGNRLGEERRLFTHRWFIRDLMRRKCHLEDTSPETHLKDGNLVSKGAKQMPKFTPWEILTPEGKARILSAQAAVPLCAALLIIWIYIWPAILHCHRISTTGCGERWEVKTVGKRKDVANSLLCWGLFTPKIFYGLPMPRHPTCKSKAITPHPDENLCFPPPSCFGNHVDCSLQYYELDCLTDSLVPLLFQLRPSLPWSVNFCLLSTHFPFCHQRVKRDIALLTNQQIFFYWLQDKI